MIAAFDVHYFEDKYARAAAVLFYRYSDAQAAQEYSTLVAGISPYISGQFYRRELPCILLLLKRFNKIPDEIVIDGYVTLGNRPALGQHLFEHCDRRIPVVGVAKSKHEESSGIEILRGASTRPLYVTSAGVDPLVAADRIKTMHGFHRVPTLLRQVDTLARRGVQPFASRGPEAFPFRSLCARHK